MITAATWLWLVVAAVGSLGAVVWHWRLWQLSARAAAPPVAPPRVSIVVPARDEAHNLPRLLASLAVLDPPAHQVIVVDDHSTDGTGDLARAAGATVVVPPPLPPGWLGKAWACHAGAAVATGDLLLFTDADTVHGPASLAHAVARLEADRADLVSAIPRHRAARTWERLQGVFQVLLLIACRAGSAATDGARRFSIGQYLLFRRAAYERIGGHVAVKDVIAEDLHLAARVIATGGRFALCTEPGVVEVRMYPEGVGGFVRGWRRSFRDGMAAAGAGGVAELIAVIGWLGGVPLAMLAALATGAWPMLAAWSAAYLATAAAIAIAQRRIGALPWWGALAFPLGVAAFVAISGLAAWDRLRGAPVRWRGRSVVVGGPR
ncbi:MAG: glycosyltransferase [Myxococcales bacterium]|nr:glycosyltransferase [Myxococcales bacterium]